MSYTKSLPNQGSTNMTSPSDNDKNKDAASDAKAIGGENKADKTNAAKETLNKIIYKTGVLVRKIFAVSKAATKDVVQELRNVNSIRKETVATAAEGTKKTVLAKTFWTKTSGKQRGIVLGLLATVVLVMYFTFSTSTNQHFKNAEIAFQNKEYEKASMLYKKAAANGLADAQFMLGYMYTTGWGVIQNNTEGIRWYRLAAEQGFNKAQYNLATIYNEGKIVTRNNAEAMRIFKMAAAKNHAPSLRSIGVMYYNGTGVPKNRVEAFNYFLEAAQLGNSDAQLDVAELYAYGGLGYLDNHRAFMWGSIALAGGNKGAQRVLDSVNRRLNGDLKEANQLISECVDSNYKQCGNKKSQLNLDLKSTLLNLNDIAYSNAVGWNFPIELTKRLAYCIGILDFSGTTSDTPTGKGAVGKVANRARDKATNSGLTIEDGKVSFNAGFNDAKKIFESEWDRGRKAGAIDAFEMERGARQAKVEMQRVVQNCDFFISNFNATGK